MPHFTDEEIIEAIDGAGGIIGDAANLLGCHRNTITRRAKDSEEITAAIEAAREGFIDLAESELRKLVKAGDGASVRFVLKTLGRHRGYSQRYEIEGNMQSGGGVCIFLPDNGRPNISDDNSNSEAGTDSPA